MMGSIKKDKTKIKKDMMKERDSSNILMDKMNKFKKKTKIMNNMKIWISMNIIIMKKTTKEKSLKKKRKTSRIIKNS